MAEGSRVLVGSGMVVGKGVTVGSGGRSAVLVGSGVVVGRDNRWWVGVRVLTTDLGGFGGMSAA